MKKLEKICKNCIHWQKGHEAYWEPERYGSCKILNREIKVPEYSLIGGILEGCVDVKDKCDTFEIVTQDFYGCVHFKSK